MSTTVVGVFQSMRDAWDAVRDLDAAGFPRSEISVMAGDERAHEQTRGAGAGESAAAGAAIGSAAGVFTGLASVAVPAFGPLLVIGPVAAALTGAGVGAAAGGLIGAMGNMGIPEGHVEYYGGVIRRGGAIVILRAGDDQTESASDILTVCGALDVRRHGEDSPSATSPRTEAGDEAFRRDYATRYAGSTYSYDQCLPAYELGRTYAEDARYSGQDWETLEERARRDWSERSDQPWEQFKDAVRRGWEHFKHH